MRIRAEQRMPRRHRFCPVRGVSSRAFRVWFEVCVLLAVKVSARGKGKNDPWDGGRAWGTLAYLALNCDAANTLEGRHGARSGAPTTEKLPPDVCSSAGLSARRAIRTNCNGRKSLHSRALGFREARTINRQKDKRQKDNRRRRISRSNFCMLEGAMYTQERHVREKARNRHGKWKSLKNESHKLKQKKRPEKQNNQPCQPSAINLS